MNRKKSTVRGLALLGVGMLALTACSPGGGSSSDPDGDVTLDWTVWAGSQPEIDAWQHLADMVHDEYPNLTVNLQTSAWSDYWSKLPTVLAGSDVPCIVGLQMSYVPAFASLFPSLNDSLEPAGIDIADFDGSIVESLSFGENLLAVPFDYGPYLMFYNKDMFAAAGVDEPQNGWTIEEFEEAAKALTTDAQYGFAVTNDIAAMQAWAPTISGVQAVTDDNQLDVDNPEIAEAMSWYSGLVTDLKVAQQIAPTDGADAGAAYLGGSVAMYVDGPWALISANDQAKFDVGVVTLPQGDAGLQTTSGGAGFGLSGACENKEEAMQAISVITGEEGLSYLAEVGRAWPARPAAQAGFYAAAPEGSQEALDMSATTALPFRSTASWGEDASNWSNGAITVINGDSPVDEFLATVQSQSPSAK